jgi:hypothetical protein
MNAALPKKLAGYVHDIGVRALDHLADNVAPPGEGATPDALQTLVDNWRAMSEEQKEDFVGRVATSVGEVIAASALLPMKRAVKSAKKVLKKTKKTLKKNKQKSKQKPKVSAPKKKSDGKKRKQALS